MQSQIAGSLALECLKMGRTTFAFSNVLNVKKVNDFFLNMMKEHILLPYNTGRTK